MAVHHKTGGDLRGLRFYGLRGKLLKEIDGTDKSGDWDTVPLEEGENIVGVRMSVDGGGDIIAMGFIFYKP